MTLRETGFQPDHTAKSAAVASPRAEHYSRQLKVPRGVKHAKPWNGFGSFCHRSHHTDKKAREHMKAHFRDQDACVCPPSMFPTTKVEPTTIKTPRRSKRG